MDPICFMKTVYLGDRAIKGYSVDSWKKTVKIRIDVISRIRNEHGDWDYYHDEDIADGCLVFEDVLSFKISPLGLLPSDYIEFENIFKLNNGYHYIEFNSGAVENGQVVGVGIEITFKALHLETHDGKQQFYE